MYYCNLSRAILFSPWANPDMRLQCSNERERRFDVQNCAAFCLFSFHTQCTRFQREEMPIYFHHLTLRELMCIFIFIKDEPNLAAFYTLPEV
jgi:hypothetical protein